MTDVDIKKLDYTIIEEDGNETEQMHIIGRTPDNQPVHITNSEVDSSFYVPTEQVDHDLATHELVQDLEEGYESIRGDDMTRIYTYKPGHVPQVRDGYDHYEADILFPNRFSLDTDIYGGMTIPDEHANNQPSEVALSDIERKEVSAQSRICYADIEVDDSNGFPDEEDGEEAIVCLTYYDNFEQVYNVMLYHPDRPDIDVQTEHVDDFNVEVYSNEEVMLTAFASYLCDEQPDVLTGWNFKKFDAMYLISRFETLDDLHPNMLSPLDSAYNDGWYGGKIKGIAVFDMLKGYKNLQFTELDSFGLADVAEAELDVGKLNEENEKIYDMWQDDINTLLEYNIRDVYLTVELERTQGIVQFYEEVANIVGGRLSEVVDYSKAADIYVLRRVNDMFVVPSMNTISSKSDGEEFEGAEVFDPATEIKDMVSVLDLASLYPMSMKTINAGPTTKDPDGDITAPNGVNFTTEHESVITEIIDSMLEERELKKEQRDQFSPDQQEYVKYDLQQTAVKVIMNTLYGILGWDRFRLYDEDVAASVTAVGREVIKHTQQLVEEFGYEVVYGDTDSVMIELDDVDNIDAAIYNSYKMEEMINASYDDFAEEVLNVDEHFFEIEAEKVYRKFMQAGKKKRYAGHIVWKEGVQVDKTDIVGLETERSDYSAATKKLIKDVIQAILMGATKEEVSDMVRERIEKMKSLEYDLDELGIPGGIGQAFDKYSTKTKQVRGSEYANEYLGENIQPGDKPKGIYVDKIVWEDNSKPQPPQMKDSAYLCWMNSSNVPGTTQFDWDKYLDIQVHGPLSRIIECTEWMWDEIKSGQTQVSFDEYETADDDDIESMFGDDLDTASSEPTDEPTLDDFDQGEKGEKKKDSKSREKNDDEGFRTLTTEEVMEVANSDDSSSDGQAGLDSF